MNYNLHQGFDTDGFLGMEALAQTIERENPDVITFQEISRGWYIDGSFDMLPWLSQRLGVPYIFASEDDPAWGNAIFSRYPLTDYGEGVLPQDYGPMERGYLWAKIDLGGGQELLVITTHLHSTEVDHDIHIHQVSTLLDFWDGRAGTVILGDLNSWPDSPEMELFRAAGLKDSFAELGRGEGYTWPAYAPYERIDYIWHTPDLTVTDFSIANSTASDHFGVAATLER